MKRSFAARRLAWVLVPLALAACDTSSDSKKTRFDVSALLSDYARLEVLANYEALETASGELVTAVAALEAGGADDAEVTDAREAWVAAREPWEKSEALLFGPVDTEGIDPAIDTWPLDAALIEDAIDDDVEVGSGTPDNIKGFHAIEYLIWDDGSGGESDAVADVATALDDASRVAYLVSLTDALQDATTALVDAWDPDGDDYVGEFEDAGQGSDTYTSQSAAMQEIVNGLLTIADEVANGKLAGPFGSGDEDEVESQFSENSLTDFTDNIEGIRSAYRGHYEDGEIALGLSDLVALLDPDLDEQIQEEIDDAIEALGDIPETFSDSITDDAAADEIQAAIDAINTLFDTLEGELLPLVQDTKYSN